MPGSSLVDLQWCGASSSKERAGSTCSANWPGSGSRCAVRVAGSVGVHVLKLAVKEKVTSRRGITHLGRTSVSTLRVVLSDHQGINAAFQQGGHGFAEATRM